MKKILINSLLIFLCVFTITVGCKKNKVKPADQPKQPSAVVDTTRKDSLSKIIIQLSGMKNSNGKVNVALYNTSASFNNPQQVYRNYTLTTVSGNMVIVLDDLPQGYYAFGLFHDENSNNSIDKNFLGIPKEGFAFSNNATANFGPPTFEQAKFFLPEKSSLTQIISLIFY